MNYKILVVFVFLQSCLIAFNANVNLSQAMKIDKLQKEIVTLQEKIN